MMDNGFYTDEFEQLLKEKADQFSMYPSKRVWHSIYNNLHPGRRWPSVVISFVLISSLILIGYLNTGENTITRQINNTSSITENTNQVSLDKPTVDKKRRLAAVVIPQKSFMPYNTAFDGFIISETDFCPYTIVKSNRPNQAVFQMLLSIQKIQVLYKLQIKVKILFRW
jgi:hypothetical protein